MSFAKASDPQEWAKSCRPTALQKTQALLVAGVFAMGAATMGTLQSSQERAQTHAQAGDTDQAIAALAEANAEARSTIHGALRADGYLSSARYEVGMLSLSDHRTRDLSDEEFSRRYDSVVQAYVQERMKMLDAYRLTFHHERLQLEAIEWTPSQQVLVDRRLGELAQIEAKVVEDFVDFDFADAFPPDTSPGLAELRDDPVPEPADGFTRALTPMTEGPVKAE